MGVRKWTEEVALSRLKDILLEYGEDISVSKYNKLKIPNKPAIRTMNRITELTWDELKAKVIPDLDDSNKVYLLKQNKKLMDRLEYQRNLTQVFLDNCFAEISKLNIKPVKIPPKLKSKENLQFHALRSDAQVGEYTDADHVQGLSHYSSDDYQKRVTKWCEKIITFKEQDSHPLGLNKLTLYHLGDQVEGENIYKGQSFYLDLDLVNQLFFSVEVESNILLTLAHHFYEIEVFCVAGNHGRPGAKGENHYRTNFDYIFYKVLKLTLANQKNIKIFISESPSMVVKNGNFLCLLNHGDMAKSWNGIPYYGLDRQFKKLHELYGMVIDYEFVGHHHTASNLADKIIMNGCLPGGSELSINQMGLNSRPSQKIFYFHPEHGINRESNLYLADQVKLEPDKDNIFTKWS